MRRTVWQLRGSTDKVFECRIDRTVSKAHLVTIVQGQETFLRETYPDESSALARATQIRERLLKGEGWTTVAGAVAVSSS